MRFSIFDDTVSRVESVVLLHARGAVAPFVDHLAHLGDCAQRVAIKFGVIGALTR
jgi:hypothetical protein